MKFQKLTAGLLALSMLCTPSAGVVQMLTAAAEETAPTSGTCGENVTWTFDETIGTLTISGTGEMEGDSGFYPWNDYSEEEFRDAIRTVVIEDGVTGIGSSAFSRCSKVTSVAIPGSVTTIGSSAFNECTSLTDITIPDSVTSIGSDAFAFSGLISVTIPERVTTIGEGAFEVCENLTEITILNPDCKIKGTSETISNGWIGEYYNYQNLTYTGTIRGYANSTAQRYAETCNRKFVSLGDAPLSGTCGENAAWKFDKTNGTLTISGTGALENGNSLTYPWSDFKADIQTVVIEDGITSIGMCAFNQCSKLTKVTIPDSVTTLGDGAFSWCEKLTEINIPDSVTDIRTDVFSATPWLAAKQKEDPLVTVNGILIDGKTCSGNVIIPDGVTSIGINAFYACSDLTGITIPDSVTSIGTYAFSSCNRLTGVTIPDSVTSIGIEAFNYCETLTEITILNPGCEIYPLNSTISNGYDKNNNFHYSGVIRGYEGSTAQSYAGEYGYTFETLGDAPDTPDAPTSGTCGENVTWTFDETTGTLTISGSGAMTSYDFDSVMPWESFHLDIQTVVIEDGVTSIGDNAFNDCENLTGITIPDSVTSIGEQAFFYCLSLTDITIPDSITSIGVNTFYRCSSLTEITIPDSVTSIGERAFFVCYSLTGITIPDSVTSIGGWAFCDCSNLTDVTIPDSVTSIGGGTFYGTPWLTAKQEENSLVVVNGILIDGTTCSGDVIIPDGVTSIGGRTFYACENLTGITIPDSVTSIGDDTFYNCTSLTDITIPDSVTSIGVGAFDRCENLTEITILNPDCEIYPSDNTISSGLNEEYNFYYSGVIRGYEGSTAQTYAGLYGYTFESLGDAPDAPDAPLSGTCGENVTWAFDETTGTLTISGTGEMENYNFEDQFYPDWHSKHFPVRSVIIQNGVTSIGCDAFGYCENLTDITVPDSVTSIGSGAFAFCRILTDITIPDSVTSIENSTFYYCSSLTTVTIPDSVTNIGVGAFDRCENLTDIIILNPECEFYDSSAIVSNGQDENYNAIFTGTIHGYANSTAQAYAEKYGYTFESLGDAPEAPVLSVGNVNGDSEIDASDAADLLIALANIGAGADSGLTAAQLAAADADGNGELDAGDAAVILQYAAYLGSGGTGTLEDFLKQ